MIKRSEGLNQEALYVDELPASLSFDVPENGSLHLAIAAFKEIKDTVIEVNVAKNGAFNGSIADFAPGHAKLILNVHLNGEGGQCQWHSAVLASKDDNKTYETSVYHTSTNSLALMSNYGISRDSSKLVFSGVSEIKNGAKKTHTRQEAKIIVFDPKSDGRCSPILKIGENDVEASHAAIVGRLNEDHLFYLQSRGVSLDEAKRLITLGYLKPIENYFNDPTVVKAIDDAIEGGI
jgi:Fe-S cluster assembly protein SufD